MLESVCLVCDLKCRTQSCFFPSWHVQSVTKCFLDLSFLRVFRPVYDYVFRAQKSVGHIDIFHH